MAKWILKERDGPMLVHSDGSRAALTSENRIATDGVSNKDFAWKLLQKWGAKSLEASREWGALSGRSEKADQGIEMAFT